MTREFDATSTTDEVLEGVDLKGKRILVTGVSSGLGVETARALAAHGASVVGAARDLAKAEGATDQVREAAAANGGTFELVELDLASLASVRACADKLVAKGDAFDVVIGNAGIMASPFGHTADGFELQFGTNHLGHFVFVNRIASLLHPGSRVVILSSATHRASDIDLNDLNFEHTQYVPFVSYARSKTANALFAVELDRRLRARGVRAIAVHPGAIDTPLGRHVGITGPGFEAAMKAASDANVAAGLPPLIAKSVPQGAATSVWAAVLAPADAVGGRYCEDCQVAPVLADGAETGAGGIGVRAYAADPQRAKALWAQSEEMAGERFQAAVTDPAPAR
jgi:NAD(P)-dependent dehydrogenase (short-subunit alcohol dehydrogenase family)